MLTRIYGVLNKKTKEYALINAPKEVRENYTNNKKIINDLKEKKFKIISKYNYGVTE